MALPVFVTVQDVALLSPGVSVEAAGAMIRAVTARAVLGYCFTKSAVVPSTFSGWSVQMSWVVAAVKPTLSMMARAFQKRSAARLPSVFIVRRALQKKVQDWVWQLPTRLPSCTRAC